MNRTDTLSRPSRRQQAGQLPASLRPPRADRASAAGITPQPLGGHPAGGGRRRPSCLVRL